LGGVKKGEKKETIIPTGYREKGGGRSLTTQISELWGKRKKKRGITKNNTLWQIWGTSRDFGASSSGLEKGKRNSPYPLTREIRGVKKKKGGDPFKARQDLQKVSGKNCLSHRQGRLFGIKMAQQRRPQK